MHYLLLAKRQVKCFVVAFMKAEIFFIASEQRSPRLYQTSISPLSVRTSIMACPRKSSDSLVNFCLNLLFKSLSSSQTRTFTRSVEL